MNYIDTIYDEKERPLTEYPNQLCRHLFDKFNLKEGMKLLDLGCGRGEFSRGFKSFGLQVTSIDQNQSEFHKDLDVTYVDVARGKFHGPYNYYDVVFCKSLLEHFFNPEKFIEECYNVLRPGGRIIVMVPDWHTQMKSYFDDYSHRQPYSTIAVRDLLKMFKFGNVKSDLFHQLPVIWKYPILKLASRFVRIYINDVKALKIKTKFIKWSVLLMILGTGTK